MQVFKKELLFEGILSAILAFLMFFPGKVSNGIFLLSMPFEMTGAALRWLSLGSETGNMIAFSIYTILSLVPVFHMVKKIRKSSRNKADLILPVISGYCFYMIYEFVNPGLLFKRLPAIPADSSSLAYQKLSLSIIFYSLCIGYAVLRLTGTLAAAERQDKSHYLCRGLEKILLLVSVLYTFLLGYFATFQLLMNLRKNTAEARSAINLIFVFIRYILQNLPVFFTILILVSGIALLKALASNEPGSEIAAANELGLKSRRAVYVTAVSNILLNFLQFILSSRLHDTDFNLEFSLFPLIIAFSAMILSGYFRKTKEIYEDNGLII